MNLDGIDVFVKVVQSGSFTAAAKNLGMPITTVSGKIANLEKRLGTTLLRRTTRKLNLTENGEVFFKRCLIAIDEIQAGENELSTAKSEIEGVLKITASIDVGQAILAPIIHEYLQQHSKLKIELILTNQVVDLIDQGIDLAIRIGRLKDSTLVAKRFMEAQACFWASPAYLKKHGTPLNPKQLKEHKFVKFSHDQNVVKLTKNQITSNVEINTQIIVNDMNTLKDFVLAGAGIGIMPTFICDTDEKAGKLVQILPAWNLGSIVLSFVYPPQRFVSVKVRSFIDWAVKY